MAWNVLPGVLLTPSQCLYDMIDRNNSGFIHWHMAIDRYFGSKVGKVQDRIPVKVLPREKDALDPGFELNFNTPSTATAPVGNGESTSKDAARAASPGALLQGIYS